MTAVTRRIAKLENQLGTSEGTLRILFEVCHAGTTQADMDPDIQILRESGFLPTSRIGHVDFGRLEPPSGQTQAQRRQQRRCKFGDRRE
jgi:ferredoxin-fold anticodon binding domain-containing protein